MFWWIGMRNAEPDATDLVTIPVARHFFGWPYILISK
jgi:uncharacterized protein YqjF (DUF2071 family)